MGEEERGGRAKYLKARPGGDVVRCGPENDNQPAFTVTLGQLSALVREAVAAEMAAQRQVPRPALLDREGLAVVLGVSPSMVDKLKRRGLPHCRIGDSPRFDLEACLAWIWKDNGQQKAEGA